MRKCVDSAYVPPVLTILHQLPVLQNDVYIHDGFLSVLAENVEEHGNLGMIFRTADAAAADLVFTSGCDPFHWRTVTGSRGSIFRVPVCRADDSALRIPHSALAVQIVAAVTGTDKSYTDLDYRKPTLFLVGNETEGLSDAALELATERVTIPMPGGTDSLNVAVSASVLLYEALRQRSGK
jgi:TrmH family RNA methyltransferase